MVQPQDGARQIGGGVVSQVYSEGVTALLRIEARWDVIEECAAPVRRVSAAGRRPEARAGHVPVQPSIHQLADAMPSAGLPVGAVNPTGLDPRVPPRRRGPRQGCRGAECQWSGAAHGVLGLDGVASGGRVVDVPGGPARQGEGERAAMPREAAMRSAGTACPLCTRDRNRCWLCR
jgi:hypothetical protein